jgi:hypothetical protein
MVVVMMEDLSYWGWIEELDPIVWAVEYSEHQNQHLRSALEVDDWAWFLGGQGFCKGPKHQATREVGGEEISEQIGRYTGETGN